MKPVLSAPTVLVRRKAAGNEVLRRVRALKCGRKTVLTYGDGHAMRVLARSRFIAAPILEKKLREKKRWRCVKW